jgi:diacylglycerol kinase family enzyme
MTGFRELWGVTSHKFEVEIDGVKFKFRATSVYVANCGSIGFKTTRLDPRIELDDGKLNVCRINANRLVDYFQLLFYLISPTRRRNWKVFCVEAGSVIKINGQGDLPVQGDGDVIGSLPVEIRLQPGALKILVPAES